MTPAEAAIREALETAGAFQWPSVTSTALAALLSELDALRARCEAGDALLIEAATRLEDIGKGGHICDAIDAHLKGAGRE